MNQEHDDHDGHRGLIDDDEVLDFILYEEITKNEVSYTGKYLRKKLEDDAKAEEKE